MHRIRLTDLAILCTLGLLFAIANAESVQYCHSNGHENTGARGFCVAMATYHNHSSASHDLYVTIQAQSLSSEGWTAIGIGSMMDGALMFVLHGRPGSSQYTTTPTLSVLTTTGHHRPRPLRSSAFGGIELRTLKAEWIHDGDGDEEQAGSSTIGAIATIVCYSCTAWPGTSISASSISQPWIWAQNYNQAMNHGDEDDPSDEFILEKHDAHGKFYVDMTRSVSHGHHAALIPMPNTTMNMVGTSETLTEENQTGFLSTVAKRPLAHLHGFLMGAAFLLLFPLGAMAIRFRSSSAFKYHWVVQASGMSCAVGGAITALIMTGGDVLGSTHQMFGLSIVSLLCVQALAGWRHHAKFARVRKRTWISHVHIWLGRVILLGGWGNLLSGLLLYGVGTVGIATAAVLVVVEATVVGVWSFVSERRRVRRTQGEAEELLASEREKMDSYFALDDVDEETEDDSDSETS